MAWLAAAPWGKKWEKGSLHLGGCRLGCSWNILNPNIWAKVQLQAPFWDPDVKLRGLDHVLTLGQTWPNGILKPPILTRISWLDDLESPPTTLWGRSAPSRCVFSASKHQTNAGHFNCDLGASQLKPVIRRHMSHGDTLIQRAAEAVLATVQPSFLVCVAS